MIDLRRSQAGFTLMELVAVIVLIGILAAISIRPVGNMLTGEKTSATMAEMDDLAYAITGNPELENNGIRTDFGYIGDVGSMPPNLDALVTNPGSFSTWKGPYIQNSFAQAPGEFKRDAWGDDYLYTGLTITSVAKSGGGASSDIVRRIASSTGELIANRFSGAICDVDGTPPGSIYDDSITVTIEVPDGSGGIASRSVSVDAGGYFSFDSIPIGNHDLVIVYEPAFDTLRRFVSVPPASNPYAEYYLTANIWTSHSAGGGSSYVLRPDGVGSVTTLTPFGSGLNYLCVNEQNPDESSTQVIRASSSYSTDVYSIEDASGSPGSVVSVTVHCRARKAQLQGTVRPTIYVSTTEYNGSERELSSSWADYSFQWNTNPNTGVAWTWSDIDDIEAGVSIKGQNANFPAYCTQVWVEVVYNP